MWLLSLQVKWNVYTYYLKSAGICVLLLSTSSSLVGLFFNLGSNFWLKYWSDDHTAIADNTTIKSKQMINLAVYGALGFGYSMSTNFISLLYDILYRVNITSMKNELNNNDESTPNPNLWILRFLTSCRVIVNCICHGQRINCNLPIFNQKSLQGTDDFFLPHSNRSNP